MRCLTGHLPPQTGRPNRATTAPQLLGFERVRYRSNAASMSFGSSLALVFRSRSRASGSTTHPRTDACSRGQVK